MVMLHPAMTIRPDDITRSGIIQPFGVRATDPVAFARHEIDPFIQAIRPTGMNAAGVHILNGGGIGGFDGAMIQGGGLGIVTAEPRTALQGSGLGIVTAQPRTALQGSGLGSMTYQPRTLLQGGGLGLVSPEVLRTLGAQSYQPRTALQGAGLGAMTYRPRTILQGFGQQKPAGLIPSWAVTLGAPAVAAGAATYLVTKSGRDAAFGALGGLLGGVAIAAFSKFGKFDLQF
jgi:hypothetical protein